LRAKVASDSDTLVEASQRLGHADTAILGPGGAKAIIVENLMLCMPKCKLSPEHRHLTSLVTEGILPYSILP